MAQGLQNPQLVEDESDESDGEAPPPDDKGGDDAMEVDGGSGDEAPEAAGEPETAEYGGYDLTDDWIDDSEVRDCTCCPCVPYCTCVS